LELSWLKIQLDYAAKPQDGGPLRLGWSKAGGCLLELGYISSKWRPFRRSWSKYGGCLSELGCIASRWRSLSWRLSTRVEIDKLKLKAS